MINQLPDIVPGDDEQYDLMDPVLVSQIVLRDCNDVAELYGAPFANSDISTSIPQATHQLKGGTSKLEFA
jgi:hypothetical protein